MPIPVLRKEFTEYGKIEPRENRPQIAEARSRYRSELSWLLANWTFLKRCRQMDGLWDPLNLFAILRSELMKNGFRDDQRLIGQLNQLKLIGLRIVHADVDEGKTGLSHCFAQGRHMFDVRVQEHRIF